MLRPVVNLAVITDRQDAVELLMTSPDIAGALKAVLKKVGPQMKCQGLSLPLLAHRHPLFLCCHPNPRCRISLG